MPTYQIVIHDEKKAHRAHQRMYRLHPHLAATLKPRPVGTVHVEAVDSECPLCACGHAIDQHDDAGICLGMLAADVHGAITSAHDCPCVVATRRPNCRNCGDPAHAETCRAAGHCPDCGTKHGIAPDSVVTANGYVLKAL